MLSILVAVGVLVASGAHLWVSRHQPPPRWGYVYWVYEAGVPWALLGALASPTWRDTLIAVAGLLAATVGTAAVFVAGGYTPPAASTVRARDVRRASAARTAVLHRELGRHSPGEA